MLWARSVLLKRHKMQQRMGNWLGDNYFELGVATQLQQVMLNHTRLRLAFKWRWREDFATTIFQFHNILVQHHLYVSMFLAWLIKCVSLFFCLPQQCIKSDQICKTEYKHVSQIYQLLWQDNLWSSPQYHVTLLVQGRFPWLLYDHF